MSTHYTKPRGIAICDFGSQYTLLIARRLRQMGFYAEVVPATSSFPTTDFDIKGVILSGGPDSVSATNARAIPPWVLQEKLPVLGICYGMQLLLEKFGGKLTAGTKREYGKAKPTAVPAP